MDSGRLKIAILGGNGGRSGVPRHIQHICDHLGDSTDITVVSDHNDGGFDFTKDTGLSHVVVPGLSTTLNPVRVAQTSRTLRRTLQQVGPFDIIWAHARLTVPLARRYVQNCAPDTRLIVTYHGSPFSNREPKIAAIAKRIEKHALATAVPHDLVFLSESDRNSFAELKLDRHRVHIAPNCSDLGPLGEVRIPDNPTLVMTTRASRQKNLKAAAKIFAELPDEFRLILCGTGTNTTAKDLFHKTIGESASARVNFGGPTDDVRPALLQSDCYLLTSYYEGQSIGALEAFEAGLPVAMPDIGGADDLAKHHPLFRVVDPAEPFQAAIILADLVRQYRNYRQTHRAQIRNAWAENHNPQMWGKRIDHLLSMGNIPSTSF